MGALLEALSEYIDFLVLGAVALAALCAPFGLWPLTKAWTYLGRPENDGSGAPEKDSGVSIRSGLIAGALFALLYFSGYFFNAIGATFVYPAHVSIIDSVASFDPDNKNSDTKLKPAVFERLKPVFGPFLSRPEQPELKNYWRDASRQIFWQVCDQKSADGMLAGGILKELRLLRGVIGLTQILLPLCLLVVLWKFLAAWRNGDSERRLARPLTTLAWPLVTFGAALLAYYLLIIPSYTLVEYDNHVTVWAAFPSQLDKDAGKIDVKQMDELLPCRKMKIVAAPKEQTDQRSKGEGER